MAEPSPTKRNPQRDPQPGDVLLEAGQNHPLVVGDITTTDDDEAEIWYGYGDHRYYWLRLSKWRERHEDGRSRVIYTNPNCEAPAFTFGGPA
jgi:hypothetical protein